MRQVAGKIVNKEFSTYLYAALLSESSNIGPAAMADASELDYQRIIWYKNWYIRDETIPAARTKLINSQQEQILAGHFGDGAFSSPYGRCTPVAVKVSQLGIPLDIV